jgi:predicted RecA/RadA family phage recombinase
MKKEIYVHIPEPCHENWEKMTPVQQGRFCESCCKQVVDFSQMSDKQILGVLSKTTNKTCGRFSADQLERPIVQQAPTPIPWKFFLSAFIPAFLLTNPGKVKAQVKGKMVANTETVSIRIGGVASITRDQQIFGRVTDVKGNPMQGATVLVKGTSKRVVTDANGSFSLSALSGSKKIMIEVNCVGYISKLVEVRQDRNTPVKIRFTEADAITLGEVVVVGNYSSYEWEETPIKAVEPKRLVSGRVINEVGEPVPFATIRVNAKNHVVADSNGVFTLSVKPNKKQIELAASSVGYESSSCTYDVTANDVESIKILLKNRSHLPDASVSCKIPTALTGFAGGLSIVRSVTTIDTAKTFIDKVFNNQMFKAYPNPARKESNVTLTFKKPGNYSVQLFDNSGKLYVQKEFQNQAFAKPISLTLPPQMTSGIYYLKATNTSSNKQFVDKIIIQ